MEHPGFALAAKIKASGFRQNALAAQLGVSATSFNEMLKGKRSFTPALCVSMQQKMGYGLELWKQQMQYDWWLAEQAALAAPASPGAAG